MPSGDDLDLPELPKDMWGKCACGAVDVAAYFDGNLGGWYCSACWRPWPEEKEAARRNP